MSADDPHRECKAQIAEVLAELRAVRSELDSLKAKSKLNSANSHQPPSSDSPFDRPSTERPKPPGKRPKGAQRGHLLHERRFVDLDPKRDTLVEFKPSCSCGCSRFDQLEVAERFQRFELPERAVQVTEYRRYRGTCCDCQTQVERPFPESLGGTYAYGDRLVAVMGLSAVEFKLSKSNTQSLVQLLGAPISTGSVVDQQSTVSRAIETSYQAIEKQAQSAKVAHADETSWFHKGELWWLWVMSTPKAVLYKIQSRRNTEAAKALMGEFDGLLGSDRFGAYGSYPLAKRQLCWAHLIRDFAKWSVFGSKGAQDLLWQAELLFVAWWNYRDGQTKWSMFQQLAGLIRARMEEALERVAEERSPDTMERVAQLQTLWPAAWRFTEQKGLEPTNNEAERMLRKAVLMRKVSQGTQSEGGNRFVERMLTFSATVKRLKRDVFAELTAAVTALRGRADYCLSLA